MAGSRIIIGSGRNQVTVDGPLAGDILRDLDQAVGAEVLDVMLAEAARFRSEAERTWPVRTGVSRDALREDVRLMSPERIDAVISTVGYARFIVSAKVGKHYVARMTSRHPLTELRMKVKAGKVETAAAVKDAIVTGLNRRVHG